jgi:glycosyltransferase involved in cell wall biosynthesis
MPAVSVIVATYNRPHLLPRALGSLADQEFSDFEVVVVNDAGMDPGAIVDRYTDRLDIRLIHNERNVGVGPTQNVGFADARGSFVAICSDDDRYLPNHLAVLHAAAVGAPGTIPYTDGNQVIEDERQVVLSRRHITTPQFFDRDRLLVDNYLPSLSMLIPIEAIQQLGGFDEDLDVLEDWELWIRLSERYPFVHHPVTTFEYHLRGGGHNLTTREVWRFDRCLDAVYRKHPVADSSTTASHRARMIEANRARASIYRFDVSYIVAGGTDPAALMQALSEIVGSAGDHTYEIIVVCPRTPAMEALGGQITGDISIIFTDAEDDLATLARRRAVGRRTHVIDRLTSLRLDQVAQPAGIT